MPAKPARKRTAKPATSKKTPKKRSKPAAKPAKSTRKSPKKRPLDYWRPSSDHAADVAKYVEGVRSGEIIACRRLIDAANRHVSDLKIADSGKGEFYFDQATADRAIDFIQTLKHSTGEFENDLFILELWQKFIVASLFGWKRRDDGFRRFRESYISVGRGNGKSTLAAAILLYLLCADQPPEPRAEIKIAATERGKKQDNGGAMIVFNECARLIERNKALSKRCRVLNASIVYSPMNSAIVPLGKDGKTKDGFNLHAFVADELHEWTTKGQIDIWDKLETAMGKRRQPLALIITTAGSDRSKLWKKKYNEACQVVRGIVSDPQLFVFIAQMDTDDDGGPADDPLADNAAETVFPKANPNLGISCKVATIERLARKAKNDGDDLYKLLRYYMNVIVRSRAKLFDMNHWIACNEQDRPDLAGRECCGGIDLGWRDDLAAFYLCFPIEKDRFASMGWAWTCEDNPHRDLAREPYASWIRAGRLIVTPGDVFDPAALVAKVKQCRKRYRIQSIALDVDNARSVELELVNQLCLKLYAFGQSCRKYNEPILELKETIKAGDLITDGDDLLAWSAANAVGKRDAAGLVMPDKSHSEDKIDPVVAFIMAFSESLYHRRATKAGYKNRGLRSLRGSQND